MSFFFVYEAYLSRVRAKRRLDLPRRVRKVVRIGLCRVKSAPLPQIEDIILPMGKVGKLVWILLFYWAICVYYCSYEPEISPGTK